MNINLKSASLLSFFLGLLLKNSIKVDAHGHVVSPRSRNYRASVDRPHSGDREYCPHCLNRKIDGSNAYGSGLCGVTGSHNYDTLKWSGSWETEATYNQGQVITIKTKITAYHGGHFEVNACADVNPTQNCFDANRLEYVGGGAPPDSAYPYRAYLGTPGYLVEDRNYSHQFRLPLGLTGSRVLLQWRYFTGNSCTYPGYADYFSSQGWNNGNLGSCNESILDDNGNTTPERFWNCMEISISGAPTPTPPSPAESLPSSSPTTNLSASPVQPSSLAPIASPTAPKPTVSNVTPEDSRLIAYVGNWLPCPTASQTAQYTHIMIGFAVSYTWNPTKNQCDTQCTIGGPVPICNNQPNPGLVQAWQDAGKKVILSFGGAGMGGSWSGDINDCWDYCFGKEDSVVQQLDAIVRNQNFNGVDLDYEYFYNTAEQQQFIELVTTGLKDTLPVGTLVTHAPMDSDLIPSKAYYQILKKIAPSIDFIMPQYYNGITRPAIDGIDGDNIGQMKALTHYSTLVNDIFDGDATKVVFGFCISGCSGTQSNANANQAATVMKDLRNNYNCNGGAFFWEASDDVNGLWSSTVNQEISPYSGCSNSPTPPSPIQSPVSAPIVAPTAPISPPTTSPVKAPISAPIAIPTAPTPTSQCKNDSQTCGPGNPCSNGACCSQWGYCGTSDDHCGECCQSNCNDNSPTTLSPVRAPVSAPIAIPTAPTPTSQCKNDSQTCGPGNPCSNGACCSQWGYCGISDDHCGECCQSNCSDNSPMTLSPVRAPVSAPVTAPITTPTDPVATPTATTHPSSNAPSKISVINCADLDLRYKNESKKNCAWVAKNPSTNCNLTWKKQSVVAHWCPLTCGTCTSSNSCADSPYLTYKKDCIAVNKNPKKFCNKKWKKTKIHQWCPKSCDACNV